MKWLALFIGLIGLAFGAMMRLTWRPGETDNGSGFLIAGSILVISVLGMILTGCVTTAPVVTKTEIVEKPTVVYCKVELPQECRDRYAVDGLQPGADPVKVNRAVLAELDQRAACEVKLRAALQGCNDAGR